MSNNCVYLLSSRAAAKEWYIQRAYEIDARAGQLDVALSLIDVALGFGMPGLEYAMLS